MIPLIESVQKYLTDVGCSKDAEPGVLEALDCLNRLTLSVEQQRDRKPLCPEHMSNFLDQALLSTSEDKIAPVLNAIKACKNKLHWQVDRGLFYEGDADLGDGYRRWNMHCQLVGPDSADFYAEDFRMGLFLLGPEVLYRDHKHMSPEVYINLTGPTGWRLRQQQWQDMPAGAVVWNPSNQVHATRIYEVPFLAVWIWCRNVNEICRVVHMNDWGQS